MHAVDKIIGTAESHIQTRSANRYCSIVYMSEHAKILGAIIRNTTFRIDGRKYGLEDC